MSSPTHQPSPAPDAAFWPRQDYVAIMASQQDQLDDLAAAVEAQQETIAALQRQSATQIADLKAQIEALTNRIKQLTGHTGGAQ